MSEMPNTPSKVAPGMTLPVTAGEQYTLTDDNGEALVIEARDDPKVIEFLSAFDTYITVRNTIPDESSHIHEAAFSKAIELFEALPKRVQEQMPSQKAGQIIVP